MSIPISRRLDFSEIPCIDLASVSSGKMDKSMVDAIGQACSEIGFFYIVNHGVPAALVDALQQQSAHFFAQSFQDKMHVKLDQRMRGYLPLCYRSYEGEAKAATNHQEGFWVGHALAIDPDDPIAGPNQWPTAPPGLKQAMCAYFSALESLSELLLEGFALALDLNEGFFAPLFNRPNTRLKLNHYPPQHNPRHEHDIGVLPHADSGGFTILWQDALGGLEIQSKNGEWVGAPPIDNTFVINLGEIMQVWSNGQFSATPHRVINRGGGDRYSIPLFVNPNSAVMVEPLVGQRNPDFVPFQYGEYQRNRWRCAFPVAEIP